MRAAGASRARRAADRSPETRSTGTRSSPAARASPGPIPVGLDPLGTLRWWAGQREVEDADPLSRATSAADGDHFTCLGQVEPLDRHRHAEHLGLERQREMVFHHGEQPAALLGVAVGIDRGLLDELLEVGPARPSPAVPSHLWRALSHAGMFMLGLASYR